MIGTFVNAKVILMLRTPDMFNIPQGDIGLASSSLVFFSMIGSLFASFFAGYVYDIMGRKFTIFFSYTLSAFLFILMPWTAPSYPALVIVRILFTMCLQVPMGTPLVADYFKKDSIGKAHILGYIGFVLGEVISVGLLFRITDHMKATDSFFIVGLFTILFSSIFLCTIREPRIRRSSKSLDQNSEDEEDFSMSEGDNSFVGSYRSSARKYSAFNDVNDSDNNIASARASPVKFDSADRSPHPDLNVEYRQSIVGIEED